MTRLNLASRFALTGLSIFALGACVVYLGLIGTIGLGGMGVAIFAWLNEPKAKPETINLTEGASE